MVEFFSSYENTNKIIEKFNGDIILKEEILLDSYIYFLQNIDRSKNRKVFNHFSKNFLCAFLNVFEAKYCDKNIKAFFLKLLDDPLLYGEDNKYVYYILMVVYDFCMRDEAGEKFANSFYNKLVESKKYFKKINREYLHYNFTYHEEDFINKYLIHYQVFKEGREEMNFLMKIRERKILNEDFLTRLIEYLGKQTYEYFEKLEYILLFNTTLYKSFDRSSLIKYFIEYFLSFESKSMKLLSYRLIFTLYQLSKEKLILSLLLQVDEKLLIKHKIFCEIQLLQSFSDFKQLFLHYRNKIEILKQIFTQFRNIYYKKSEENLLRLLLFFNEVSKDLTVYFLSFIKKQLFFLLKEQMKIFYQSNEIISAVFQSEYEKFLVVFDDLLKIYQKFEKESDSKCNKKKNIKKEEDHIPTLMKLFNQFSEKYELPSFKRRIVVLK